MNVLSRFRNYRERRAYERSVQYRQDNTPYGAMYAQLIAYRRTQGQRQESPERIEAADRMKEKVREAFMTHPAATQQDFERCWPALRDELFLQYTLKVMDLMHTLDKQESARPR